MDILPLVVTYIIDDDKLHHFGMKRIMNYINIPTHVLQFYNGLQALDFIRENLDKLFNLPNLMFLDVNMPVMNGWQFLDEFIKLIPSQNRRTTIYMVTSSISEIDIMKAASYQEITEYVIKPASVEQVKELLVSYTRSIS